MKKLILAAFAVTCAINVFAQGVLLFQTRTVGTHISRVYAPLASNIYFSQLGNGTADFPAGTTLWTGFPLIGSSGIAGQYGGSSTLAQLLTAPGLNASESGLVPQTPITTFRTGAAAGFVTTITVTANNVGLDAAGTIEMAVWDNSSGQYPTWKEAFAAWTEGNIAAGESGRFNATFGGTGTPPNLVDLQSFNLYYLIPEPSGFALAALGLATLLVFRRRKS